MYDLLVSTSGTAAHHVTSPRKYMSATTQWTRYVMLLTYRQCWDRSSTDMLNNLMSNPQLRQMAENYGRGGGMPDMSSLMSDPNIADM
jgi:hypothetical protein